MSLRILRFAEVTLRYLVVVGLALFASCADTDEPVADGARAQVGMTVAGSDPALSRGDGQCLPDDDTAKDTPGIAFTHAYQVVEGTLGAVCFGEPDDTIEWAWSVLADLTPPGQLNDLSVFAGFSSTESSDDVTLAFVQALDDDGDQFLMAVNVAASGRDPDEATLTMAHEFTHVFTALETELDRTVPPESCETFDNGEGCYTEASIIHQWWLAFWGDVPGDPTSDADAEQRCDLDPGFFGSYAASNPEEDFAESFSAYVLQVEPRSDAQQQRLDFIDSYPGLREFRDRAVASGHGPLAHSFEPCG